MGLGVGAGLGVGEDRGGVKMCLFFVCQPLPRVVGGSTDCWLHALLLCSIGGGGGEGGRRQNVSVVCFALASQCPGVLVGVEGGCI